MKIKKLKKGAALLGVMAVGLGAVGGSARAQDGGGVPDLSDFAGAIARSAQAPPAKSEPRAGEAWKSGMAVPSVKPGEGARGIGRKFRLEGEKNGAPREALQQLEDAMPKILVALEDAFEKNGFSKRDMGVAYAYVFIDLYENATSQSVPEAPSKVAMRTLGTAISTHWGPKFATLEPADRESLYESLIISTSLTTMLTQQFDEAGKADEAKAMRQSSAQLFETLIGVPPAQVKIAEDGTISGLSKE